MSAKHIGKGEKAAAMAPLGAVYSHIEGVSQVDPALPADVQTEDTTEGLIYQRISLLEAILLSWSCWTKFGD